MKDLEIEDWYRCLVGYLLDSPASSFLRSWVTDAWPWVVPVSSSPSTTEKAGKSIAISGPR